MAGILSGCQTGVHQIDSITGSEPAIVSGFPSAPPRHMQSSVVWGNDTRTVNTTINWLQKHGVSVLDQGVLQNALAKLADKNAIALIDEGTVLQAAKVIGANSVVFADRVGDSRPPMVSIRGVDISSGLIILSGNARLASLDVLPSNDSLSSLTDQALDSAWGIKPEVK